MIYIQLDKTHLLDECAKVFMVDCGLKSQGLNLNRGS